MACSATQIERLLRKNACEWATTQACIVWTAVKPGDKVSDWVAEEPVQEAVKGDTRAEMFAAGCISGSWPDGWADMDISALATQIAEGGIPT